MYIDKSKINSILYNITNKIIGVYIYMYMISLFTHEIEQFSCA